MTQQEAYKSIAQHTRKVLADQKKIKGEERERLERTIKAQEFLSTCTQEDICALFDAGPFGSILKGFLKMSIDRVNLDRQTKKMLVNSLQHCLDMEDAYFAIDYYREDPGALRSIHYR